MYCWEESNSHLCFDYLQGILYPSNGALKSGFTFMTPKKEKKKKKKEATQNITLTIMLHFLYIHCRYRL